MEKLWQTRRPPTPLSLDSLPETSEHINTVYWGLTILTGEDKSTALPDQRVWSVRECYEAFVNWYDIFTI